ncbi:sugar phosphate isomerase/epimerase family protein [Paenibacillus lemnae]|uniref:Sugar phosphate isomerase/epimerase n=1 Tax=Paenibacillus lemnae TaxID=1330551 RepID=A0A848M1I0_PAELE|nr:TIM barrel protein [Paenibacillus lemnae]NMO94717.1 sugar phosphate isomerase/epimerase [Paenibacillus lemnae]
MKQGYSFSTMWNLRRHQSGKDMINEIKGLGFAQVELNYNVTEELLADIRPMVDQGDIIVSSVHNVFPFIADRDYDTDSVMLGFDDPIKRQKAVDLLKKSADYADSLGAKAVVVHPGEVPFDDNIDAILKKLWVEKGRESKEYQTLWGEMLARRNELAPIHVTRIRESLEDVCSYIEQKGYDVRIGIETRSRCNQIPTLQEANQIITELGGDRVGIWYDIGHGTMMGRMGLYDNEQEILELKDKVLGVHIHETVGIVDHWCPYIHSEDLEGFDVFLPVIAAAPIKVYELRAPCEAQQIERSYQIMKGKMDQLQL